MITERERETIEKQCDMAEGVSNYSLSQTGTDDSVQAEIPVETKEMVTELKALGDEFRRLLDPEVTHSLAWLFN